MQSLAVHGGVEATRVSGEAGGFTVCCPCAASRLRRGIRLALHPPDTLDRSVIYDGETVSVDPSIGHGSLACRLQPIAGLDLEPTSESRRDGIPGRGHRPGPYGQVDISLD